MATKSKLTICFTGTTGTPIVGPLLRPLRDGSVTPRGIELDFQEDRGLERNTLRMLEGAFDVGEMATATFISARNAGAPVVALPVHGARHFVQTMPNVRSDSDIWDPAQLKGRKVGGHIYWQTDAIWARSFVRVMHGVEPKDIKWIMSRPERLPHDKYPPGVEVRVDPLGRDTPRLLLEGEVDAVFGISTGGRATREKPFEEIASKRRYIYRNVVEAEKEYYKKTGIFPITHVIGIREELAEAQPWIIESLYDALVASKERYGVRRVMEEARERPLRGGTAQENYDLLGEDPYPYGIEANRHVLQTLLTEVYEQGFIEKPMSFERFYATNLPDSAR